jgi:hypothetical protein
MNNTRVAKYSYVLREEEPWDILIKERGNNAGLKRELHLARSKQSKSIKEIHVKFWS